MTLPIIKEDGIWRTTAAVIALVGFLATATIAARAVIGMPAKLEQHSVQTEMQTKILEKMLCIQVADHQRADWTKCLVERVP